MLILVAILSFSVGFVISRIFFIWREEKLERARAVTVRLTSEAEGRRQLKCVCLSCGSWVDPRCGSGHCVRHCRELCERECANPVFLTSVH